MENTVDTKNIETPQIHHIGTLNRADIKRQIMGPKVTRKDKQQMVRMRALDYSKQEIAEDIGISRSTVDYHLKQIREEIEEHSEETREFALAEYLFEPEDALEYAQQEIDFSTFRELLLGEN